MNTFFSISLTILGGAAACIGSYVLNALPDVPTADILGHLTMQHISATAVILTGMCSLAVGVLSVR